MNLQKLCRILAVLCVSVVLWIGTSIPALADAPAHDDFDSATVISALPFSDNVNTSEATSASDDPVDCMNNGSVWYAFTPAADMHLQANTFDSDYDTALSVYTGVRGDLALVPGTCNDNHNFYTNQSRVSFAATGGTTYYFLIGFCCGNGETGGGNLVFSVEEVTPPSNDNFASATEVPDIPFADTVEIGDASLEPSEPNPNCVSQGDLTDSVWYSFTPATDEALVVRITSDLFYTSLAIYTGSSLSNLTEERCNAYDSALQLGIAPTVGTTYYVQAGSLFGQGGPLHFTIEAAPDPVADFYYEPGDPSPYDVIQFYDFSFDPAGIGIASSAWDFGDGTTATDCCPTHQYAANGEYVVTLTVITPDGRQASTMRTILVETHDVVITKFETPKSARMERTRTIVVGINSRLQAETVTVELYGSGPGGYRLVGTLTQYVPKHTNQRTTDFYFSYTFTPQDAAIGKVTFRAIAYINDRRDALPADNEAISFPTRVTDVRAATAEVVEETEMQDDFVLRSQMDEHAEIRDLFQLPTRWLFLPLIDGSND